MNSTKCVKKGNHTWSGKHGSNVESLAETLDSMEVVFTCEVCGAEAHGTVEWGSERDGDDDD